MIRFHLLDARPQRGPRIRIRWQKFEHLQKLPTHPVWQHGGWLEVDLGNPSEGLPRRPHARRPIPTSYSPVSSWKIEYEKDGHWQTAAEGTAIGKNPSMSPFPTPVTPPANSASPSRPPAVPPSPNSNSFRNTTMITRISTRDARYPIGSGHGSDAIHKDPIYSYAVTLLTDDKGRTGTGLAFTLGEGNDLVCRAAEFYADRLKAATSRKSWPDFGALQKEMADEQQFRWLGPHKGVVQLALASVTNACWDLWAKTRGLPLVETAARPHPRTNRRHARSFLSRRRAHPRAGHRAPARSPPPRRASREGILASGYPGYDTSVGWFNYTDEQVRENCKRAIDAGFTAMKLKVGSKDPERDLRRARIVREVAGPDARIMVDANQQWTLPQALDICARLNGNQSVLDRGTHPPRRCHRPQDPRRCHRAGETRPRRTRP